MLRLRLPRHNPQPERAARKALLERQALEGFGMFPHEIAGEKLDG
jgi:hypothetical protein